MSRLFPAGKAGRRPPRARNLLVTVLAAGWALPALAAAVLPARQLVSAEVALSRGEYPEATRQLRAAARASRDPAVAERAARVAFDYAQPRELEQIATDWLDREPKAEAPRRFRAIAELELDNAHAAAADFRVLVKTAYATPAAAFASLQESLGSLDAVGAAAAAVGELLADYPTTPEAFLAHAELSLHAANSKAALGSVERVLALRPGDREGLWLRARAHVLARDCDQGLTEASGLAAEGAPRDRLIYAWLLSSCSHQDDAQRILKDLTRVAQIKPEALELLAGNALEAGRLDEAEGLYREALAVTRAADTATFGLAQIAERRGNTSQAERLYSGITEGGRAVAAQLSLYRLLVDSGESDVAARVLDDFVIRSPERLIATTGRAELLSERGRSADALGLLERARHMYPDDANLALSQAAALDKAGRLDDALAVLRAEQKLRPQDPLIANSLGYTLADHGRELPAAQKLIVAALAVRPDSPAIQDSYGWVLFRQNRPADAVPWLARAYAGDPDPEVAVHLGEAQWALGDEAAAATTWNGALKHAPGNAQLQEVLTRRGLPLPAGGTSPKP